MKHLNIFYLIIYWTLYGTAAHHGRYGVLIRDSYPDVPLFHSLSRGDFPSRCLQPLQCPLVSPLCVPDPVEDSLLQNWCRSWTSQSTRTLAVLTDMHHRTELSFVDEFRWVSALHNAVLLPCMLQAGPQPLHYYCAVVLHSCTLLPPVGHSPNHHYHSRQLTIEPCFELIMQF